MLKRTYYEDTQHDCEDDGDGVNDAELDGERAIFFEEEEDPIEYRLGRDMPIWRPRHITIGCKGYSWLFGSSVSSSN
jgi:hypothetical protein